MDSIDFDIANYTDEELYQLVDLPIDATKEQINRTIPGSLVYKVHLS